jgi:hypothetical protein
MTVRHYLVGYGKTDGNLRMEILVPAERMDEVKKLLSLYPDDPGAIDPYELYPWQARDIAKLAGGRVAGEEHDFFLQAFVESDAEGSIGQGDRRETGGQAATAVGGDTSFAG